MRLQTLRLEGTDHAQIPVAGRRGSCDLAVVAPTASAQSEPVQCLNLATFDPENPQQPPELLDATIVGTEGNDKLVGT